MDINLTLIIGIILLIAGIWSGYKTGLIKGITHLVALVVTLITLALILMLSSSFSAGETRNTLMTLVLMVILGTVYSVVRFVLKSFKAISKLPIIKFLDNVLGVVIGIMWVTILYMALIALGMRGYLGVLSGIIREDINSNLFLTIFSKYNIFL